MDKTKQALYLALNDMAYNVISDPDYDSVVPPPENKCPGSLIHAWGIEMCRVGFDLAMALFKGDVKNGKND